VNLLEETDIQSSYAARNKGLAASKGQVLAFTDSDCIANDSWISAGVSALRENDAFLAGGDVAFTFSKSASPAEYYDAICNMRIKEHVEQFGMCFTANLFVRREVIDDLGTFPSTLQSGGDAFFTSRATMAGYKLVFAEDAVVEHPTRKLGASCCKAMRTWKGKMQLMLRSKKKGPKNKSATPGWFLTNINPVILRRRLIIDGYGAGLLRLTGVILTAYIILFVGLIGAFAGMIPEKNNR
jgi:GT2 family glycosyltransferase